MAIAEAEIRTNIQPGMKITEDELLRLPKDGRKWELVEGRLKEVPTEWENDLFGVNLIFLMRPFAHGHGYMSSGQAGFHMAHGNIRLPDVSFTRKERIPGGKPSHSFGAVAPDLCIEIISPSEERADMARKVHEYFAGGAEQVWHIFPEAEQIVVFTSPTETQIFIADDIIDAGVILPGFSCRVGDILSTE